MEGIDILIIGTNPPCPRCDLLTFRVHEAAEALEQPIEIRHTFFDSDEATAVGRARNPPARQKIGPVAAPSGRDRRPDGGAAPCS